MPDTVQTASSASCLMHAWQTHASELRAWVVRRLPSDEDADDFMQELFLKSLRRQIRFCTLDNALGFRAEVNINSIIHDRYNCTRDFIASLRLLFASRRLFLFKLAEQ